METGDAGMGNTLLGMWMAYGLAMKEGRTTRDGTFPNSNLPTLSTSFFHPSIHLYWQCNN